MAFRVVKGDVTESRIRNLPALHFRKNYEVGLTVWTNLLSQFLTFWAALGVTAPRWRGRRNGSNRVLTSLIKQFATSICTEHSHTQVNWGPADNLTNQLSWNEKFSQDQTTYLSLYSGQYEVIVTERLTAHSEIKWRPVGKLWLEMNLKSFALQHIALESVVLLFS